MKIKEGFSVIELSIVVLIIGLIFVGVIQTNSMIYKAKLANARTITVNSKIYELEGLLSWYDAVAETSFGSITPGDNSSVSIWNDSSPSSLNFFSSTVGYNLAYYLTQGINGLPALSFNGSATKMKADNYPDNLLNDNGAAIFLVMNFPTNASVSISTILSKGSNDIKLSQASSVFSGYFNNSAAQAFTNMTSNNVVASFIYTRGVGITENIKAYSNGVLAGNFNLSTSIAAASNSLFIGSNTSGTDNANFKIGELIIFERSLTDTERKDIERYLGSKWGIAIAN